MKLLISCIYFLVTLFSISTFAQVPNVPTPQVAAKAYTLVDFQSNQTLASLNPTERVEPASLTKLMTAYLSFAAIKQNRIALNQAIPISEHAWKAEGSRMFVEPNKPVTADELLHGIIIQSGNDASIAMAEAIAGSENLFADLMNKEAKRLGMNGSHFVNATGLPNKEHYSTAQDMAILAGAIIRDFPEFFKYYSQKEYTYNNITQPNRNRLLWIDRFVDGMKTGHTEAAGFCLVSTAKRGDRRLVAVVLGTSSDNARTIESQKLLNYGFQFFEMQRLYSKNQAVSKLAIYKGTENQIEAGFHRDVYFSLPRDQFSKLKATLSTTQPLLAPLKAGQKVGTMKLSLDNKVIAEYPVVALQDVAIAGFFGRAWDSIKLLWKK